MAKKSKLFVIEIEIEQDQWGKYKKGQTIMIPISTISTYHAELKFSNMYVGSEMPPYKIVKIHECDTFLFSPERFFKLS